MNIHLYLIFIFLILSKLSWSAPLTNISANSKLKHVAIINEYSIAPIILHTIQIHLLKISTNTTLISEIVPLIPKGSKGIIYNTYTNKIYLYSFNSNTQNINTQEIRPADLNLNGQSMLESIKSNWFNEIANNHSRLATTSEMEYSKSILNSSNIKNIAYTSLDGGINWKSNEIPNVKGWVSSTTCSTNNNDDCVAISNVSTNNTTSLFTYISKDGGHNWLSKRLGMFQSGGTGVIDITCNGEHNEHCVVVGSYYNKDKLPLKNMQSPIVYTTFDSGNSWIANYPTAFGNLGSSLNAVSCNGQNGQYCTAIGSYNSGYENYNNTTTFLSYTSTDGGLNWIPHIIEKHAGVSQLKSITCDKNIGQNCIAGGYLDANGTIDIQPIIYTSKNGGNDWESAKPDIPSSMSGGVIKAITCNRENNLFCIAVGSVFSIKGKNSKATIWISTDGGFNWIRSRQEMKASAFTGITCDDNLTYCTVFGHVSDEQKIFPVIYTSKDKGQNWLSQLSGFENNGLIKNIEILGSNIAK